MELQQLIYFAEVAKYQNLTKAAGLLYISQPALSKSIQRLEEELDTRLFLRVGKSLHLTEHGQIFYNRVEKILDEVDATKREMYRLNKEHAQTVRLKVRALAGLMPEFLKNFSEKNANISFSIFQGSGLVTPETAYDLFITPASDDTESRNRKFLLQENFFLLVSFDSDLAKKDQCTFSDLEGLPYIHTSDQFFMWDFINAQFEKYGCKPEIRYYCDEPSSIVNLVRKGYGTSLMPEYSFPIEAMQGVKMMPMAEPGLARNIYLTWADGIYLPQSVQLLRKSIIKYFSDK